MHTHTHVYYDLNGNTYNIKRRERGSGGGRQEERVCCGVRKVMEDMKEDFEEEKIQDWRHG